MAKEKTNDNRFRVFASTVYPESAPDDWLEILEQMHVPALVSPVHDRDIEKTGEPKKPHYHVMFIFGGKKSPETVRKMFQKLGGVGCEIIQDQRAMARYLCHLDQPEKALYDVKDVRSFGGADYQVIITLDSDKYRTVREMIRFIKANNVESFSQFNEWCADHHEKWFRALCDNCSYIIKEHITSRVFSLQHNLIADTEKWTIPPTEKEVDDVE